MSTPMTGSSCLEIGRQAMPFMPMATQYGEHRGFAQAVGKAADGGCRLDARVEGIDGR